MKRQIIYYFDLLTTLTKKEIKVRYRNSILGYLWSIAHPLAFAFVFYVAFKVVMKIDVENYTIFLISGLFPWQWFSNSVNSSSGIFLSNANLIKKVNFPLSTLPLTSLLNDAFHFLFSIPVIALFVILHKVSVKLSWLYGIPILMLIQLLFIYGIALAISSINLFFRDMERLVIIFTTLLFYFTPIFYPETMIPENYQFLVKFNPLACLMINWRNLFLTGNLNELYLLLSILYSIFSLTFGYILFRKLSIRFAEVL